MDNYIKKYRYKPIKTANTIIGLPSLDLNQWKPFRFGDLLLSVKKGHAYTVEDLDRLTSLSDNATIPYITRTAENNGCEFRTSVDGLDYIEDGNAITIGDTTATCFYQKERFITGDHIVVIRAEWLNEKRALFVLSILNKEKYKYSYGRAFVMDKIENTFLLLPVVHNDEGLPILDSNKLYSQDGFIPDWKYMDHYIACLPYGDRIGLGDE